MQNISFLSKLMTLVSFQKFQEVLLVKEKTIQQQMPSHKTTWIRLVMDIVSSHQDLKQPYSSKGGQTLDVF